MSVKVMKFKFFVVLVVILAASGCGKEAQTDISPAIRSTNWISGREVNGKLYTDQRPGGSTGWETVGGDIVEVLHNKIVVQKVTKVPVWGQNFYGQRVIVAYTKTPELKYVLQNYGTKNAAVGESIWVGAMRVGTTKYKGETLELWDCGKPHRVMVVTTNYPPSVKNKN